jgi:hypothetical protein
MSSPTRGWSPFLSSSQQDVEDSDWWLDRELGMLERALAEHGEMPRRELGRQVGCRYWGPGRFARALRAGVKQGRIAHPRRGVYGPV